MERVTLQEAQNDLPNLVRQLAVRGEVLIIEANRPIARLSPFIERGSLRDLAPASVGEVLRPYPSSEDDLLEEMSQSST
jgi:antitoxin (DNA-binding transcriptional repressor) of toxin-antitoxin stability system